MPPAIRKNKVQHAPKSNNEYEANNDVSYLADPYSATLKFFVAVHNFSQADHYPITTKPSPLPRIPIAGNESPLTSTKKMLPPCYLPLGLLPANQSITL